MNSYLLIFAIFLLVLLIGLIGFLIFLGLRFVKNDQLRLQEQAQSHMANAKANDNNKDVISKKSPFCTDHSEILSEGVCSIDGESYCEQCLTRIDDMKFARKNVDEYSNFDWSELTMFKQSKSQFDLNNRITKVKTKLWEGKKIPLIIRGHFKINVEDDSIETFTTLLCRTQDLEFMKKELSFIKL